MLNALATPALAVHDWSLTLAGTGPCEPFVHQATALGLNGRARFLGWVDEAEAHRLLAASDVLALPSYREGLSMALLEAMAHGLAIVATPVGANSEAIEDGRSGLLVPVGDTAALAEALARLCAEPDLRRRLQAGARQRWQEAFDIGEYCTRLARIYERALGR